MAKLTRLGFDLYYFTYRKRELERPREYFHAHDGIEFLYIHEGNGKLILKGQLYAIEAPTLIFYQPYQPHMLNMGFPYTRSILKVKPMTDDRFGQLYPALQNFLSALLTQEAELQVFRLTEMQDTDLQALFRIFNESLGLSNSQEIKEQFLSYWPQFLSYFKTRMYPLLQPNDHTSLLRETEHVEKVIKWIEMNFKHSFDLAAVANDVHLTPSYLSRLFRKYTGSTIMEYTGKRRLEEASILLRTSSISIGQVAHNSGFVDVSYFCRSFKKKYDTTPQQYRLINR